MPINTNQNQPSLRNIDTESLLRSRPPQIVGRGRSYYNQGRAEVIEADESEATVHVSGSLDKPYIVKIWLDRVYPNRLIHIECNCPYARGLSSEICKHKVAALLELREHYRAHKTSQWSNILTGALAAASEKPKTSPKSILIFRVKKWASGFEIEPVTLAPKQFPEEVRSDNDAIAQIIDAEGNSLKLTIIRSKLHPQDILNADASHVAAANILSEHTRNYSYYYYNTNQSLDVVLPLLEGSIIYHGNQQEAFGKRLSISTAPAKLELVAKKEDDVIHLEPHLVLEDQTISLNSSRGSILFEKPIWMMIESMILPIEANLDILKTFTEHPDITIPIDEEEDFFNRCMLPLAQHVDLKGDAIGEWQELAVEPIPRLYLQEIKDEFNAQLRFGYGDFELIYEKSLPYFGIKRDTEAGAIIKILRNRSAEEELWKSLSSYGLKRGPDGETFVLRTNANPIDFLLHQVPRLSLNGYEVYGEEDLKSIRVNRSQPTMSLSVSSGIDWFDLQAVVNFGDLEVSLAEIRKAVKKRERYVKLADGSVGEIPTEWMDKYKYLFDLAEDSPDKGLRLSKTQAVLLDQVISDADSSQVDAEIRRRLQKLRDFSQIESRELPKGLKGELRHYQKAGYDWLHFLHEYEFGGCLADDMGIGKTIQALTFLLSHRESGHAKSANLVVVPRSLLANWQRESERFTPDLRVMIYADLDRAKDPAEFDQYDLILTTYGVMRRDLAILSTYRFHYVILDESQAVKNPLAQTTRSTRALSSDHRLVLTGTPVENSAVELWSQFAFLNPGMLGSLEYFKKEFVGPIERKQDNETARVLRAMVHPFILRRTKEQVAPELPPRTERIVYCDMEPAQRKTYNKWRDQYRAILLGMIEEEGMNSARMKILEGLLRLRQISNHPMLVDKDYKGDSAKMEVLIDTLETLHAEGHKALVFSQFTKMLKVVKDELDARKIPYLYLDGHTRDRQERVDKFQEDPSIPFFLISLKAGGVGLNLTAADYVIHIDPWWNPAVERQASDRTHRIGQEKPVFIHKLIARDSVEEKILELQERKKQLVDQLVSTETGLIKSLTVDDIRQLFS